MFCEESEDIRIDDVVGVTELVELSYDMGCDFGRIVERKPFCEEEWVAAAEEEYEDEETSEDDSYDEDDDDYLDEED